jgi:hypothetical protein
MNNGVLMLALGLLAGIVVGQALKQCAPTVAAPAAGKGWADVLIATIPAGKDLLEDWLD